MLCAFDLFMEDSYCSKILKHQSLISTTENLGYKCQLLVFGSLGHVHKLAVRGLCIGGISETESLIHNNMLICFNLLDYYKNLIPTEIWLVMLNQIKYINVCVFT